MKYHISHLITLSIKYVIGKNTHPQPKLKGRIHEYIIFQYHQYWPAKSKKASLNRTLHVTTYNIGTLKEILQ